jgi:diguanylate cyclase (GGDEF)-like protein/PAS domain S-box-containing protein
MHSLLKRQIKKIFGDEKKVPESIQSFISVINDAYEQSDNDREMLERSLEISSEEMREAYKDLQTLHAELEKRIQERTAELYQANDLLKSEMVERKQVETMREAVYRIAQAAEEIKSLNELYPKIHYIISDVMSAENFYIALYDSDHDELSFVYYVDEVEVTPPGRIRPDRGVSAYVLRTGKSLLCDQTVFEKLERHNEVELIGPPSPIWLGVPLILYGRTIGIMAVQHYSDPKVYGENEQRILEFVSTQVARAIERKRVEEELRMRETRYSALIKHSVDNISLLSADGQLLYENSTINRPLGYPEGLFLGHNLFELIHPDDLARANEIMEEVLTMPATSHTWELRLRAMDGSLHWMEGTATNLLDEPAVHAIVLNYRDVTVRKQTEATIDRQHRILSALNETTPVLMGRLELNDVLQAIVIQAARMMDTPDGYIYLVEPDEDAALQVEIGIGIFEQYKGFKLRRGEGVAGKVWETGQSLVIEDYQAWTGRSNVFDTIPFHPVVGIPLKSGTKVIGVIGMAHRDSDRMFSEEDVEFLTRFSEFASIALENAHLHTLAQRELTARKEAEVTLRQITDNMQDIITEIGSDSTILYASPSHQWVLGIDPDELIGHLILERLHPDDIAEAFSILSQAVERGEKPDRITMRYQHAEGHYLWMECVSSIIMDKDGEFAGAILSSRDVTQRKETEARLRNSERQYRLLADNADDVIWVQDMNLHLTYISPAVQKLLGYTVDETLASGIMQLLVTQSTHQAQRLFSRSLVEAKKATPEQIKNVSRTIELEVRKKDNSTVWTETRMSFLLSDQGKPIGILGVTRDITERRQAADELRYLNSELEDRVRKRTTDLMLEVKERRRVEAALRESETRYALAVQGANDGLWDWNLKTNDIYFSQRWKSMLGYRGHAITDNLDEWFTRIHPEDYAYVQNALQAHLNGKSPHFETEYRMRDAKQQYRWMLCRGLAVLDENGTAYRMAGSQTDITDRKVVEERLAHDAMHDALTALPNRTLFVDRLDQRLEHSKRHKQDLFAILFIDMDRFKVINDSLGHAMGDRFLIATAQRLQTCLRPEDTIARLGGDEFAILLNEIEDISDAIRVAERIQSNLQASTMLGAIQRSSSASIGITIFDQNYTDSQELLRDADSAMYRAKAQGGGQYQVFNVEMYKSAMTLLQLETDLKRAVEFQEWEINYQPVIHLGSGEITGVEALIRWRHPKRGLIPPGEFIPVAEESGLIIQIGEYVLREACRQVKVWREADHPELWVAVNLSARQFQDQALLNKVRQILHETGLPGNGLRLEVTETVAMKDFEYSIKVLQEFEAQGIHLSLDDFGNGYSSLGYLKRFPIKSLKIDRSFIRDIHNDKNSEAITSAIIALGHNLNLEVVAEGVETEAQLAFLRSHRCDDVQGFLFSQPVPVEKLEEILNKSAYTIGEVS